MERRQARSGRTLRLSQVDRGMGGPDGFAGGGRGREPSPGTNDTGWNAVRPEAAGRYGFRKWIGVWGAPTALPAGGEGASPLLGLTTPDGTPSGPKRQDVTAFASGSGYGGPRRLCRRGERARALSWD